MKKYILALALILGSILSYGQTWVPVGNTLQRQVDGTGFKYRFSLGSPGFYNISDSIRNATNNLIFSNGLTRSGNNITLGGPYSTSIFVGSNSDTKGKLRLGEYEATLQSQFANVFATDELGNVTRGFNMGGNTSNSAVFFDNITSKGLYGASNYFRNYDPSKDSLLFAQYGGVEHLIDSGLKTVQSKIFYNVLDYGAVGDGVTNDSLAFSNAIAAVPATGGTVYIPKTANHYYARIILRRSNITFFIEQGAVIDGGVFHIEGIGPGTVDYNPGDPITYRENIRVIGKLSVTSRLGTYYAKNLYFDEVEVVKDSVAYIAQTADGGSRGIHFYWGTRDVYINKLTTRSTKPGEPQGALFIDANPSFIAESMPKNFYINDVIVDDCEYNGLFLYQTDNIHFGNVNVRNALYDGVSLNGVNNLTIGSLSVANTNDNALNYANTSNLIIQNFITNSSGIRDVNNQSGTNVNIGYNQALTFAIDPFTQTGFARLNISSYNDLKDKPIVAGVYNGNLTVGSGAYGTLNVKGSTGAVIDYFKGATLLGEMGMDEVDVNNSQYKFYTRVGGSTFNVFSLIAGNASVNGGISATANNGGSNDLVRNTDLSAYQTTANLSTDLTPSATKYPSVNAVNTALGGYVTTNTSQTITGSKYLTDFSGIITGDLDINGGNFRNLDTGVWGKLAYWDGSGYLGSTTIPGILGYTPASLTGGNTFSGVQDFTNGSLTIATGYKDSGFINTLQSNTLAANVNTYLPADGGTLLNNSATGWASYADNVYTSGSPFVVNSGATSTLPNNAATVINSQIPIGVTSFYNSGTSKITPQLNGDSYLINVRFTAVSSSNTGLADISLDIGGAMGVIDAETISLRKGAGSSQIINVIFDIYSLATFVSNGGEIKINSLDGNTSIYNIQYKITRTHKAR